MIVVVVARGQCGRLEMAQQVHCSGEIGLLRRAFDMSLLIKSRVNDGELQSFRWEFAYPKQVVCTMYLIFSRPIIAKPFPCTRIEVRWHNLRLIHWLLCQRTITEHENVRAWARRRIA